MLVLVCCVLCLDARCLVCVVYSLLVCWCVVCCVLCVVWHVLRWCVVVCVACVLVYGSCGVLVVVGGFLCRVRLLLCVVCCCVLFGVGGVGVCWRV